MPKTKLRAKIARVGLIYHFFKNVMNLLCIFVARPKELFHLDHFLLDTSDEDLFHDFNSDESGHEDNQTDANTDTDTDSSDEDDAPVTSDDLSSVSSDVIQMDIVHHQLEVTHQMVDELCNTQDFQHLHSSPSASLLKPAPVSQG
jgi:hypothetical protein